MKIKVLRRGEDFIEIEILGEGHTFCNALCNELYNDPAVTYAAYNVPHPLEDKALLFVRVSSKSPIDALIEAASRLRDNALNFKSIFESSLKSFRGSG